MRAWPRLLCLLLVFPTLAGCGKAPAASAGADKRLPTGPHVVYISKGTLLAVTVQPGQQQRYVLVGENVPADASHRPPERDHIYAGGEAKLRFVRLDLKTGQATTVKEFGPPAPVPMLFDRQIAYARDGRIAYCEGIDKPFVVHIVDPDGSTRSITMPEDVDALIRPVWHPDSSHLLFFKWFLSASPPPPGRQEPVLATVPARGSITERTLPANAISSQDTTWSADGQSIYSSAVLSEAQVQLWRTAYPSLAYEALATYSLGSIWQHASLPTFMAAEESGTLAWLTYRGGSGAEGGFDVWRLAPGGKPSRTRLVLEARPRRMALSPDGESLAFVQGDGTLAVARLSTGVPEVVTKISLGKDSYPFLSWALGGNALLVERDVRGQLALVPTSRNSRDSGRSQ
jgi:hypothetical protein